MRTLITGGTGYLGAELARQAVRAGHEVTATYATRPGTVPGVRWRLLDIRDRADVITCARETSPGLVIHTAYRQSDWATTAVGAAHVAEAARGTGARLVHVSSDAVFSGAAVHYGETAVPDPITPYGAAKAAAEVAVAALDPSAVIARTSLIAGDGGSSHEALVHDLVSGRRDGVLFTDDVRCPVHVGDLASALLELAASTRAGIHHVAGADAVSRHELGVLIAHRDGLDPASLRAASRREAGIPGPLDVRLDSTRTQQALRTHLRGATQFLQHPGGPAAPPHPHPHRREVR
ncbi:MAG: dTDP-4-dehydrorhamnose reductase [Cryptosporangiaceae bacterium]|nr:dTDP-4-dehydrorhamnose reductase [Cryptosporangiaceae bacterium]